MGARCCGTRGSCCGTRPTVPGPVAETGAGSVPPQAGGRARQAPQTATCVRDSTSVDRHGSDPRFYAPPRDASLTQWRRLRALWNNRETGWDPSTSTDLHRIEVFDGVISDESSLHSATLCSREEFRYILERTGACATASGDMPLFRDDESRTSDPGNRCKLRFRHALLMSLIRKKDNPTQGTLQAIFGIDQTSVCRYLKVMDRILASVLPTAKNVSKEIAACKTKEEFKRIVPGPGGGDVTADGTHCPVQRPLRRPSGA